MALTLAWLKTQKNTKSLLSLFSDPETDYDELNFASYWILQVTESAHIYNTKTKCWDCVTNRIFCSKLDRRSNIVTRKEIPWD